jgi:hypothetical protein
MMVRTILASTLFIVGLLFPAAPSDAKDISTNGTGGGPWSDPATWHGKTVPGPTDEVIVQKFDVLTFDRNDDGKVSCRKLQIDPKGFFNFKTGSGKIICCVEDAIDNYGIIKLDGTKSATDVLELRLVGDKAKGRQRKITLANGAMLLLYGKSNLPEGRCNVALRSPKLPEPGDMDDVAGLVEADGKVSIDWQRAYIQDVKLHAKKIDNTGAKQNERLNILENQFSGHGCVHLEYCDTPTISRNTFEYKGEKGARLTAEGAIYLSYCPLSEIKNNTIRGGFNAGIWFTYQPDAVVIGNTIDNCTHGISGAFGITNTIVKQCHIRGCDNGLVLQNGTGVVEDTVVEGGEVAFTVTSAQLQLTNFQLKNLGPKAVAVKLDSGTLSMLNCNITPGQIKMGPPPAKAEPEPPVTCLQYLVFGAKKAPAESLLEVRTAVPALAVDADDPNVRNSPAQLVGGLSPLPTTNRSLIVKSWCLDDKGKTIPPPEYSIKVLGPAIKEGAKRPILHTMTFRPQENALRSTPADATPTVEVNLK